MEEVKLTCGNCGEETFRPPKPEPKNAREAKQVLFHCESCGARNLRDGSAIPRSVQIEDPVGEIPSEPEKKTGGNGILVAIIGIALSIGAAILLKKNIGKPVDTTRQPPQDPFRPLR